MNVTWTWTNLRKLFTRCDVFPSNKHYVVCLASFLPISTCFPNFRETVWCTLHYTRPTIIMTMITRLLETAKPARFSSALSDHTGWCCYSTIIMHWLFLEGLNVDIENDSLKPWMKEWAWRSYYRMIDEASYISFLSGINDQIIVVTHFEELTW